MGWPDVAVNETGLVNCRQRLGEFADHRHRAANVVLRFVTLEPIRQRRALDVVRYQIRLAFPQPDCTNPPQIGVNDPAGQPRSIAQSAYEVLTMLLSDSE